MNAKSKILVTGGGGFLGTHVVELLKSRGFNNLFIPRQKDYNLTKEEDVIKMYKDAKPEILIHFPTLRFPLISIFKLWIASATFIFS